MNVLFRKLWRVALQEGEKLDERPGDVFAPLGLFLVEPVFENWGYPQTPVNAVTFGSTGVDGEHFSFLTKKGKLLNSSPIVMTVPMAPEESVNIIVGENLVDFLSLGYQVSFSALPSLAYSVSSRSKLIADLVSRVPTWDSENPADDWIIAQKYLSKILEKEFELRPWDNVETKLRNLESQYFYFVETKPSNKSDFQA